MVKCYLCKKRILIFREVYIPEDKGVPGDSHPECWREYSSKRKKK